MLELEESILGVETLEEVTKVKSALVAVISPLKVIPPGNVVNVPFIFPLTVKLFKVAPDALIVFDPSSRVSASIVVTSIVPVVVRLVTDALVADKSVTVNPVELNKKLFGPVIDVVTSNLSNVAESADNNSVKDSDLAVESPLLFTVKYSDPLAPKKMPPKLANISPLDEILTPADKLNVGSDPATNA